MPQEKERWTVDGLRVNSARGIVAICPLPQEGGRFDATDNARLIAAAPNLLEACEFGHYDEDGWPWLIYNVLIENRLSDLAEKFRLKMQKEVAAIKKAEGTADAQ